MPLLINTTAIASTDAAGPKAPALRRRSWRHAEGNCRASGLRASAASPPPAICQLSQVSLRRMSQTGANVRRTSRNRGWTAAPKARPLLVRAVREGPSPR